MQTNFPVHSGTGQNINPNLFPEAAQSSQSSTQAVDAEPVIGLKRAAIAQCLSAPEKVPLKLRNIIGLEMPTKVVNKLTRSLKKSDPEQGQKLVENFVDSVFAKAETNPDYLKKIEVALGIEEPTPPEEQVSAAVAKEAAEAATSPTVPTVTEDEYIEGLQDSFLNEKRESCKHFQYNMDSGLYTYHESTLTKFNRRTWSPEAAAAALVRSGQASRVRIQHVHRQDVRHTSGIGIGTDVKTDSCNYGQNILNHTNREECDSLLDGDMLAFRRYALLDDYARHMNSLLNSLQDKIEKISLPDKQSFAVKVAVADGYRASYVAQVQQLEDGLHWQRKADPDNLVISNNFLNITFKTKKDLSGLISSGKTLGELEAAGQVIFSLASKYEEADQEALLSHARQVRVQRANLYYNLELLGSTTHTFKDGRFGKGIGGRS